MSGNVGLVTNSQESLEFYDTLSQNAAQDPLWNRNESEAQLQNTPKIIEHGRCLHCKHWVGDKGADLVQLQHVMNANMSFSL